MCQSYEVRFRKEGQLPYQHDTYDRRIQLGASRRRREDAELLHNVDRWAGAIYLGGYTIECSLKALICYNEGTHSVKDTKMFKKGVQGVTLHNLTHLLAELPVIQRTITLDRTGKYREAWNTVTSLWRKDILRYWDRVGDRQDGERFMNAMRILHEFILGQQGETK
jgi:hypothetical protein